MGGLLWTSGIMILLGVISEAEIRDEKMLPK